MNITVEFVTNSFNSNSKDETLVIGPSASNGILDNSDKQTNKKAVKSEKQNKQKGEKNKKKQNDREYVNRASEIMVDTPLMSPEVNTTTPLSLELSNQTITINKEPAPAPSESEAMSNNSELKIVTPDLLRKFLEGIRGKMDKIHELGKQPESITNSTTKIPDVNLSVNGNIESGANETTKNTNSIISSSTTEQNSIDTTTVGSNLTTFTSVSKQQENSTGNNEIIPNYNGTTLSGEEHVNSTNNGQLEGGETIPEQLQSSGMVIITENNSTSVAGKDIDIIIFPSSRADIKQRKNERKQFCQKIDFGDATKGFSCCKKTLNCFDELPETLDETIFHHGNANYKEAERLHMCRDIDSAFVCYGDIVTRPNCQNVNTILDKKLKPQIDKVKLFYFNNCNRGTSLSPSSGPDPTLQPFPPDPSVPGTDNKGAEQFQSYVNSYAPFIGGAIMGVFALVVIIIFAVYCTKRSNKRRRSKEQRDDPGRDSSQSSRYKTVSYTRRKSDIYAEIDEKSMITTVSYCIDSYSNDGSCRKLESGSSSSKLEIDNHGYLSPRSSFPEDDIKPDITAKDANLFTHGYIELKSESDDSAQSYAKLEPQPDDDYVQPDSIPSSISKAPKSLEEPNHMYFVLEKESKESEEQTKDMKDFNY